MHNRTVAFVKKRSQHLDVQQRKRREGEHNPSADVACPECGRICSSMFGLRSHI